MAASVRRVSRPLDRDVSGRGRAPVGTGVGVAGWVHDAGSITSRASLALIWLGPLDRARSRVRYPQSDALVPMGSAQASIRGDREGEPAPWAAHGPEFDGASRIRPVRRGGAGAVARRKGGGRALARPGTRRAFARTLMIAPSKSRAWFGTIRAWQVRRGRRGIGDRRFGMLVRVRPYPPIRATPRRSM